MNLCIFCGSREGVDPVYRAAATAMGKALAAADAGLVYGGGRVGLMGVVADSALAAGGRAIGVIPQALHDKEVAHLGLTDLQIVGSMHERKARMDALSDGFVAMPGGAGTLEEIFEQWTWAQLGIHAKPVAFLNVAGYFDPLFAMIDRTVASGFTDKAYRDMLIVADDPGEIIGRIAAYDPPAAKWLGEGETVAP